MNKTVTMALACLLATSVNAEEVNRSVDASKDGHVDVSNISGSVTVRGWGRNSVEVTGTLGRNVEELIVERDGDKVLIKVKVPRNSGRAIDSELKISIPQNSSLDVGTVSADIEISNLLGEQSLHSVSGDVVTEYAGDEMSVESVSGDVEVSGDGADGEIHATAVSGDITLTRVGGEVKAEIVSGDLEINEGSFSRVRLETVNGEIVFNAELREDGRLDADSVNGDIDIQFSGEATGRFSLETFNGKIRNCFGPKPERTSKYTPGLELEFSVGDTDGRVKLSTLNGDIEICQ